VDGVCADESCFALAHADVRSRCFACTAKRLSQTQDDNTVNAVRERTGLGGCGGVLIPSMAVDEHVEVGEDCVAVSVQFGKKSNRPGVRGTLTSGRPYAHLGRTPWDISGESLGSRFALLSRPGSIQDSGSDLLPRDNNGRSHGWDTVLAIEFVRYLGGKQSC
jgi:hypothetical protein